MPKSKLLILKLGGSAITDKKRRYVAREDVINSVSKELSKIDVKTVLIHGGGSFAHPIVKDHGIHLGYRRPRQLPALAETKFRLVQLNQIIMKALSRHGVSSVPFMPSSFMVARGGRILRAELKPIKSFLKLGVTPVLFGDVVADVEMGFSVVSGDQLAVFLAGKLGAGKVIFGCDVDGVYIGDPKKHPEAKLVPVITPSTLGDIMRSVEEPTAPDVTHGMLGKLKESVDLVRSGVEVVIMNLQKPELLPRILRGEPVGCTRFIPKGFR